MKLIEYEKVPNIEQRYSQKNVVDLSTVSVYSKSPLFWICEEGHEFVRKPANIFKAKALTCPICTNKQLLSGFNDFHTRCKKEGKSYLLNELDMDYNPCFNPKETLVNNTMVNWVKEVEENGKIFQLRWQDTLSNRFIRNASCPYLVGKKVHPDFNSLAAKFPNLIDEWDYEKNGDKTPYNMTPCSQYKAWWKITVNKNGKDFELSWQDTIAHRTSNNRGCPYLSGFAVQKGFNDVASEHPEILDEWDFDENNKDGITPYNTSSFTKKNIAFKCPTCKEKYRTRLDNKILFGNKCKFCNASKGEKEIMRLLKSWNVNYEFQYKFEDCKDKQELSFDFGILDKNNTLKAIVEYDGEFHFNAITYANTEEAKQEAEQKLNKVKRHDKIKTNYCNSNKIPLLRIHYADYSNIETILYDFLTNTLGINV